MNLGVIIVLAAAIVVGGSEPPKSAKAATARRSYEESLKAAEKQRQESAKTIEKSYQRSLQLALDAALTAKNLKEANEIDAALKAAKENTAVVDPQSDRLKEVIEVRKNAENIAETEYHLKLKAADQEYLAQLQSAMETAMEAKDLKEANRIDATIVEIKNIDRHKDPDADNNALIQVPKDGKAVTKGSFTVFSIPADPKPGQTYSIIIELRLPAHANQYKASDLSGQIRGSDRYTQKLPYDSRVPNASGYPAENQKIKPLTASTVLDVVDNKVQIVVKVPGAAKRVRDVILIRSEMLNEEQELTLSF